MTDRYRIAIVGAGPAGTCFALTLLTLGVDARDLLLVDRAKFPRQKLCGGGIPYRGTKLLAQFLPRVTPPAVTQKLALRSRLGERILREPGPQWLYDRAELDFALLEECRKQGIAVCEESPVRSITSKSDGWQIETDKFVITTDWLIGADGANGVTRRAAKLAGGITGRLLEGVFEPTSSTPKSDTLIFDFDPIFDGIPGYAWIFPYPKPGGSNLWKIGIMDGRGHTPGARLREWTQRYAERNGFRALDAKLAGWPEHYYSRRTPAHRPGLILIGEAHGIDPLLGEGITPAMQNAIYAARRLRSALDAGTKKISNYETGFLCTEEGWNLFFQEFLANRLYGSQGIHWIELFFRSPEIARLGESARLTYGKLARHAPQLLTAWWLDTLRSAQR